MTNWRKVLLPLAVLLALALVFTACTTPSEEPDGDNGEGGQPSDEPVRLVVAQDEGARSWDPPADWETPSEWLIENAYDYLFYRSADGSSWVPQLAKSWERLDDYTIRFNLVDNAKFQDGTPLTCEDVKYHYERILNGTRDQYIVHDQYTWIDTLTCQDDYTLDVKSVEPDSLFMWKLAQQNTGAGIPSKAYVEKVGPEGIHKSPMGSGMWKLKDWARDEYVLFELNEDYWDQDAMPNYDELMFKIIPEPSTRAAELLAGNVDLTYRLTPQDKDRIDSNDGTTTMWSKSDEGYNLAVRTGVNPKYEGDPDLDREFTTEDWRIRKAIELALDKEALRDLVGGDGQAFRGRNFEPLPEANEDLYGPEANLYDPEQAQQLIADAGYEPGEATLVFHARSAYPDGDIARAIESMLEDVGFNVDLRLMDNETFNSEVYFPRKSQELMLNGLSGNLNPFFLSLGYHSNRANEFGRIDDSNIPGIDNYHEQVDALLNKAWTTVDDDQARLDAYHEALSLAAEARARQIGLFQVSNLWGLSDRVEFAPRFDNAIWGRNLTYTGK